MVSRVEQVFGGGGRTINLSGWRNRGSGKKKRMQGQGGAEMEDPSVVGGADGAQEEMNDGGERSVHRGEG